MSLKPGIGKTWYEKWWEDVYPADEIIVNGKASKPPVYYDGLLALDAPDVWQLVKAARVEKRKREEETEERLLAKETCTNARLQLKRRGL